MKLREGETFPARRPFFRTLGISLLTPVSGRVLAAIAVVALGWLTARRNRGRRRHGLPVPGAAATAARVVIPSALIVVFVTMMNAQGGIPLPVIVMLVIAMAGSMVTQSTT